MTQTLRDVRWGQLDYLLIDLPPGTGEPQQSLVQQIALDGAVIVTTPQDLSLLDASRSLGLFRQAGVRLLGLIENMSYLTCPHCGERIEVFHHSERRWDIQNGELPLLGQIPLDAAISRGIDAGHPLVQAAPDLTDAQAFREIAQRASRFAINHLRRTTAARHPNGSAAARAHAVRSRARPWCRPAGRTAAHPSLATPRGKARHARRRGSLPLRCRTISGLSVTLIACI